MFTDEPLVAPENVAPLVLALKVQLYPLAAGTENPSVELWQSEPDFVMVADGRAFTVRVAVLDTA